jgi:hypothetical protein
MIELSLTQLWRGLERVGRVAVVDETDRPRPAGLFNRDRESSTRDTKPLSGKTLRQMAKKIGQA